MNKKGVSAVSGNTSPVVGEKYTYHIAGWYPDTLALERDPSQVTWELFIKRSDGKFGTTHIKKKGIGDFTFGEKALGHTFRLEAYLYKPEGGGLIITPRRDKIPRISKVELFYVDDSRGDTFSFMEKLRARVYTVNLFDEEVVFTLWEDDAKGGGHNKSNAPIATQKTKVDHNGIAATEFLLSKALTQKAMQGETDPQQLEFYITVEYYSHKKHASDNVEINNPFLKGSKPQFKKPPISSVSKAKGSPAEQKPKSKKEERGILENIDDQFRELWDWSESKGTIKKDQRPTIRKPEGRSPVVVSEAKQEKKEDDKCLCKGYDLVWGNKIGCNERKKVVEVAKNLEVDPNWLMTVMALETAKTFSPAIDNGIGYVGLIQFGKDAAETVGTTQERLVKMSFIEQMDYVHKHLMPKKEKYKTLTDLYLAVLYPKACGHGSERDYVVLHGAAYRNNPLFFKEKGEWEYKIIEKSGRKIKKKIPTDPDGNTYVWEVTMVAQQLYTEGLSVKENNFSCGSSQEEEKNNSICPKDCSQCFEYADVWENPEISSDNGGKNNNRYGRSKRGHKGVDILSGPVYKAVHSLMCGIVEAVVTSFKTNQYGYLKLGNVINVKSKDKNGKTIYILYCHLDKVYVKVGDKIQHGQKIALSGSTGNASYSGLPNGVKGHGIDKKNWHCHIEACADGAKAVTFLGKNRLQPEDYMKTKFDNNGNAIK